MRKSVVVFACVCLLAAGGGAYWLHGASAPEKTAQAAQPAPVPVQVAEVKVAAFPIWLGGLGGVVPNQIVQVRSRVDGQIQKIYFKEGQSVAAGAPLFLIDPRPYQATLDQAKAKKAQDAANLANAKLDLDRDTELVKRSAGTRQQLDTQQSLVNQLTAQVQADDAAIESAQTQLDYTQIKAPIDGRTSFLNVDQGNIVHAADTTGLVSIAQVEPIAAVFTAPEGELGEVSEAAKAGPVAVEALSVDGSKTLAKGRLSTINNQVDPATGTIQLKATFDNKDEKLWPSLSVSTRMLVRTIDDAIIVPTAAIQHGPDKLFAYVVEDGAAHARDIEVAQTGEDSAVVSKGLKGGDKVVVAGQYRLKDGARVEIRDGQPVAQNAGTR